MSHSLPAQKHQHCRNKPSSDLQTISGVIAWVVLGWIVLMVPGLVILASPFLTVPDTNPFLSFLTSETHPHQQRSIQEFSSFFPARADTPLQQDSARVLAPPRPALRGRALPHDFKKIPEKGHDIYLLMDTSQHRLFVKQGEHVLHVALASIGSGKILEDPKNPERMWIFETPKGSFRIQTKLENPVWIRPDWAFIEQGNPIPHNKSDRLMPGVLGPFALGFGDGYFIHGALYTNLLGQNVTHGCIQLHPEDLRYVFQTVPLGAPLIVI